MSAPPAPREAGPPVARMVLDAEPRYAGLATRVISFVVDATLITVVALIVALAGALILFALHLPHKLDVVVIAIGGAAYVLWSLGYFVAFWSTTGQSPGSRVMQIRVLSAAGERIKPRRALVRCVGMVLGAIPLFAGYVPILFGANRRAFQDYLARTVVVIEKDQISLAAARKATASAAAATTRQRRSTAAP